MDITFDIRPAFVGFCWLALWEVLVGLRFMFYFPFLLFDLGTLWLNLQSFPYPQVPVLAKYWQICCFRFAFFIGCIFFGKVNFYENKLVACWFKFAKLESIMVEDENRITFLTCMHDDKTLLGACMFICCMWQTTVKSNIYDKDFLFSEIILNKAETDKLNGLSKLADMKLLRSVEFNVQSSGL